MQGWGYQDHCTPAAGRSWIFPAGPSRDFTTQKKFGPAGPPSVGWGWGNIFAEHQCWELPPLFQASIWPEKSCGEKLGLALSSVCSLAPHHTQSLCDLSHAPPGILACVHVSSCSGLQLGTVLAVSRELENPVQLCPPAQRASSSVISSTKSGSYHMHPFRCLVFPLQQPPAKYPLGPNRGPMHSPGLKGEATQVSSRRGQAWGGLTEDRAREWSPADIHAWKCSKPRC